MSRTITIRGFDAVADRITAAVKRRTERVVERGMQEILTTAQGSWPVSSGDSAGAFQLNVVDRGGTFALEIRNTSGYAQYINQGSTYDALIRRPWLRFLRQLPTVIGDPNG